MKVERADFDDLVTLVAQAPPEKDRAGVRILLRAIADGSLMPGQILARWTWRLSHAVRKQLDRKASQEYRTRSGCSARSPTRAATGTRRTPRSSSMPRSRCRRRSAQHCRLGRGLHPRATQLLEAASGSAASRRSPAGSPTTPAAEDDPRAHASVAAGRRSRDSGGLGRWPRRPRPRRQTAPSAPLRHRKTPSRCRKPAAQPQDGGEAKPRASRGSCARCGVANC